MNQRSPWCALKGERANVTPFTLEAPLMRLSVASLVAPAREARQGRSEAPWATLHQLADSSIDRSHRLRLSVLKAGGGISPSHVISAGPTWSYVVARGFVSPAGSRNSGPPSGSG